MQITLSVQTLLTLAAAAGALAALLGYLAKGHRWLLRLERQEQEMAAIQAEQQLLTFGVLACLKGLKEQGCNGPVTEAIARIEKHLNERAHEGGKR